MKRIKTFDDFINESKLNKNTFFDIKDIEENSILTNFTKFEKLELQSLKDETGNSIFLYPELMDIIKKQFGKKDFYIVDYDSIGQDIWDSIMNYIKKECTLIIKGNAELDNKFKNKEDYEDYDEIKKFQVYKSKTDERIFMYIDEIISYNGLGNTFIISH